VTASRWIDQLLRDRRGMAARVRAASTGDVVAITRAMLATIVVCMAIVGAALGSYRGGVQIAYAALKLPIVIVGTAALSAPALTAIGAALGRPARLAHDLALVVVALAFGSLLLVACTPLLLLAHSLDVGYHATILLLVAMFAIAGVAALRVIGGAVSADAAAPGRVSAVLALCVVFAIVGGQLSWALRPYLVRPASREDAIAFVHPLEGSLVDAISDTIHSTRRGW
jgi:hypothetical protein